MSVGGIHRGVRPPLGAHGGKLRHNWTQWGGRTPPQATNNIYELYLMSWRYTIHCTLTIHYLLHLINRTMLYTLCNTLMENYAQEKGFKF